MDDTEVGKTLEKLDRYLDEQGKAVKKQRRRRGIYSKMVVAFCIMLAVGYTGICLFMQYQTGTQPEPQLTVAFFAFITVELWNLAKIRQTKKDTTTED